MSPRFTISISGDGGVVTAALTIPQMRPVRTAEEPYFEECEPCWLKLNDACQKNRADAVGGIMADRH